MSITKKKLEELYYSKTQKEVCAELGISQPTLTKYLKEAGIPLKGRGSRPNKIQIKGVK